MGRLIDYNDVYNAIQITTDNFGVAKRVVEDNILTMLSKIETVEAIPKDQYKARLKADMVAMLTALQTEIEELDTPNNGSAYMDCVDIIQQKINELKENSEKQKNRKCACYDCKHFDRKGMSHCTIHEDSYGDTRCFDYKENKE